MKLSVRLSDKEVAILEQIREEYSLNSISDAVRKLISVRQTSDNNPNTQVEQYKMIVRHLSDISRKIDAMKEDQDEPATPPRRRRKHLSYEEFSRILEYSSEEDQEEMNKLCKDNPEHWDRYLAENR